MFEIETEIRSWGDYLRERGSLVEADILELETHLRDEIASLRDSGLDDEEAFLVAVKRLGKADALAGEFSKVNTERLWKHLMVDPAEDFGANRRKRELPVVIILALLAGSLAKIPELFGIRLLDGDESFYLRNAGLFVLPPMAVYFFWKFSNRDWRTLLGACLFVLSAVLVNIAPFNQPGQTQLLSAIHLPILLWLAVALIYAGPRWAEPAGRMDLVRFSGETFIYTVLILCGGAVLVGMAQMIFGAIGVNASRIIRSYVIIYGAAAAPIVAAYLVEAKRNIIENLAPVLARIFAPLFLVLLITLLAVMIFLGKSPYAERDFLIGFDLLLAVVLGIVLYTLSARDPRRGPGGTIS